MFRPFATDIAEENLVKKYLEHLNHLEMMSEKRKSLSLKFVTQDFTDPGLLKIRRSLTGLSLWFCLHKCF